MNKYYVNKKQNDGDHEVHKEGCRLLNAVQSKKYLGTFANCHEAVREARKHYKTADGCYHCSKECHTS